ncbi:MAG: sigma-70 family RNA polymerase sigma factor [Gemmatimonadaceae bacterium]|nr:sigma-70 family RNA polymerase sigma factor [Gemmatimonadaceae bacterium]
MTADDRPLRVLRANEPATVRPGGDEPEHPDADISRALQHLIGRFDAFVRRTAARHGLAGADLDEVVQDLRVRIWKSFGTAELIRRANATYMHRAAVSASLDMVRRRRSLKSSASSLDAVAPASLIDPRTHADSPLATGEVGRAIHAALALLSESRRGVVRMYLAGYDRHEIAELLGWTEGRTRNLLYRGLDDLRHILASRGITPEHPE